MWSGPRTRGGPCPSRVRDSAFTLIEIAIALAVVAFGLIALLGMMSVSMQADKNSSQDTQMALGAEFVLSSLQSQTYGSVTSTNYAFDYQGTLTNISLNPAVYNCSAQISPIASSQAPFPWLASNPNVEAVKLTFTWPGQSTTSGKNAKILWTALSVY